MGFKIGQRVVCISTSSLGTVKKEEFYTISDIRYTKDRNGSYGVRVLEAHSKATNGYTGYIRMDRFKPLELDYEFAESVLNEIRKKQTI